jgi:hypothetical protein
MRLIGTLSIGFLLAAVITIAQAPAPEAPAPVGTVADVMVSMTYPAANEILLAAYRGGPKDEKEWVALQRSAVLLAESGNALTLRGRARDQGEWMKDARILVDVGANAYKAARAKDAGALVTLSEELNASCITCHKQYRPNVHPRQQ